MGTRAMRLATMATTALLLAACGSGDDGTTAHTTSTVTTTEARYADGVAADWLPPAVDVYRPAMAPQRAAVLLHGGGMTKDDLQYAAIATALATRGVVVYVPNWGPTVTPGDRRRAGWTTADIVEEQRRTVDEVACAVAFAAVDSSVPSSRLVVIGHSAGANLGIDATSAGVRPFAGCRTSAPAVTPHALLLWDGDWLMSDPTFDVLGADLGALMAVYSPWPGLTAPAVGPILELAVTPNSRSFMQRDAMVTTEWLRHRDPSGVITADLAALGAFDDGRLDVVEVTDGFRAALEAKGRTTTRLELGDPATVHTFLAPADLDQLTARAMALTAPA